MTPTPAPIAPSPSAGNIRAAAVTPHAWHAFGGVWRLTFRRFMTPTQWLVLAGGLALLALIEFAHIKTGRTMRFYNWIADFYLSFLTPILAFVSGAGAIREDMKSAAADYVLIRPVRRPVFVVFKFISHVACIQVGFLLALAVLMGVAVYREIGGLAAALPWLIFAQALTAMAFSAFGFLCGTVTSKYFILGLAYAGVVEMGLGSIPTQISRLSMLRQVNNLLHSVLPNIGAAGESQDTLTTVVVLVAITAVMVAATAGLFAVRELVSGPTKE